MKLRVYGRDDWDTIDVAQWASLADASISINPFYEHWNLLPALRNLADASVSLLTIESDDAIHALLPVIGTRSGIFVGIKSWKHNHCFLNTPLFRTQEAIKQLVRQALAHFDKQYLNLDQYAGKIDFIADASYSTSVFSRPCQKLDIGWSEYLSGHSKRLQSEYRRVLRRAEKNSFQYSESSPGDSPFEWLDEFMQLEGAGWKGGNNSAIFCNDRVKQYYQDVLEYGWSLGKLQFQKICQHESPVAISFRCVSREHCYEVKTCFDEDLRNLSPGLVLELKNLEALFESENIFADTCSSSDNAMLNRLWLDQMPITSTLIFNSTMGGMFAGLTYGSWRSHKYRNQPQT
jgi:CelD/BcsL family acetyltransferase involved in cellulose biosynthesis